MAKPLVSERICEGDYLGLTDFRREVVFYMDTVLARIYLQFRN